MKYAYHVWIEKSKNAGWPVGIHVTRTDAVPGSEIAKPSIGYTKVRDEVEGAIDLAILAGNDPCRCVIMWQWYGDRADLRHYDDDSNRGL